MTLIKHPKDYVSKEAYTKEITNVRTSLTELLISAYREGKCTNQITELLRYIKLMLFSCTGNRTVVSEKFIRKDH